MEDVAQTVIEPERFGRYTVHERLGAGGMATVHRATLDIGDGIIREVALKRLLPQLTEEPQLIDDFVREAKLAAQLQHPNIVRILELGRIDETYFIVMELVRGHSLLQLLRILHARDALAPIGIVVALLAELLDALDYASSATGADGAPLEIVHRDLSPSNLILTDEGTLKIIDFGVARSVTGTFATSSGLVKGKLGYMALEVLCARPIDRRADIFSAGVVAWELLTGRRLFVGHNEYEVMTKIRDGATTPPSAFNAECSPELDEIVMHALARDPDNRWPSAAVMKRALDTVRRTYRHGVPELAAWKRTLVPEPFQDETTTLELTRSAAMPSTTGSTVLDGLAMDSLATDSLARLAMDGELNDGVTDLGPTDLTPMEGSGLDELTHLEVDKPPQR
jgi:eukaryotic-like serine/threonine-protein kinase